MQVGFEPRKMARAIHNHHFMKPYDKIGSPIFSVTYDEILDGMDVMSILPSMFPHLSQSEIRRRIKAGALKINGKKSSGIIIWILDAMLIAGKYVIRVSIGKTDVGALVIA